MRCVAASSWRVACRDRAVNRAWIAVGPDAARFTTPARRDVPIEVATVPELSDRLRAGQQRILVCGGDAIVHDVVEAIRPTLTDGSALPALPVRYPDDPFIDPSEPVRVLLALFPSAPNGIARTIGVTADEAATLASLPTPNAWGPLDVGVARLDEVETVLVSMFDAGIDRLASGVLGRRAAAVAAVVETHGRAARARGQTMTHERREVPLGWIAIANGQFDGELRIAPRAVPHDRAFDLVQGAGDPVTVRRWRRAALRGAHVPDRRIAEQLADQVMVSFDREVPVRLDGRELRCSRFEVRIERLGIALKV